MKLPLAYVVAAMALFPIQSFAAEKWHTSTVNYVYPMSNGDFVLAFDTDPSTCVNGNTPRYLYVTVGENGVTAAGSSKLYAAAMVALTTRQTVTVVFDDATSACYVSRLIVRS